MVKWRMEAVDVRVTDNDEIEIFQEDFGLQEENVVRLQAAQIDALIEFLREAKESIERPTST